MSALFKQKSLAGAATVASVLICAVLILAGCGEGKTLQAPEVTKEQLARAKKCKEFLTEQDLIGKPAVIEFGSAVECELSDEGLEWMIRSHEDKIVPDASYLRVEIAQDDAAVEEYYKDKNLKFPVYRDGDKSVMEQFEATSIPTFVITGKFGRLRYRGQCPGGRFEEWANTLLAEKSDPGPAVPMFGAVELDIPRLLAKTVLPSVRSGEISLARQMSDNGVVVVFVDTSCPFAGQALKDMPGVIQTLSKNDINSVLINIQDAEDVVKEHFAAYKPGAPLLYDTTPATKQFWNVQAVPTVIYITAEGEVGYNGKAFWTNLAQAIEKTGNVKSGSLQFGAKGTKFG